MFFLLDRTSVHYQTSDTESVKVASSSHILWAHVSLRAWWSQMDNWKTIPKSAVQCHLLVQPALKGQHLNAYSTVHAVHLVWPMYIGTSTKLWQSPTA